MFRVAAITLLGVTLAGQDVTFRTGARLVELQVVVTARDGRAVMDLTRAAFTLLDGGKPREIAFFMPPPGDAVRAAPQALPPGLFSNRPEYAPGAPRSVTCILMDDLNSGTEERLFLRARVAEFLKSYAGPEPIALYLLRERLSVVHDFTEATTRVAAGGLDGAPESSVELNSLQQDDRMRVTAKAMAQIARRLAGVAGRKNLVWIGNGMPMTVAAGMTPVDGTVRPALRSLRAEYERAVRALNEADVAVYPVDAMGLAGWNPSMAAGSLSGRRSGTLAVSQAMLDAMTSDRLSGMRTFAEATGGVVTRNTNELASGIRAALDDARASYTLAFYAPEEGVQPRELRVKLRGAGLLARHRRRYSPLPAAVEALSAGGVHELLTSPVAPTAILLNARVHRDGPLLKILLQIEPNNLAMTTRGGRTSGEVMVWLAQATGDGRLSTTSGRLPFQLDEMQWVKAQAGGLVLPREVAAEPGAVSLRIAVRDVHSGAAGALDVPLAGIP